VDKKDTVRFLKALGCSVKENGSLEVEAPTFRPDLEREIDLIEEVARLNGFENIPEAMTQDITFSDSDQEEQTLLRVIKERLTAAGFSEGMTMGLSNPDIRELFSLKDQAVEIKNPLSEEANRLRGHMLESLLPVIEHNLNHRNDNFRLFEIEKVHGYKGDTDYKNYYNNKKLALVWTGSLRPRHWSEAERKSDFFTAKGELSLLLKGLFAADPGWEALKSDIGNGASVSIGKNQLGSLIELAESVKKHFKIKVSVYYAELDIAALIKQNAAKNSYKNFSRFPRVVRDFAFIIDSAQKVGPLIDFAVAQSPLVEKIEIFDLYEGDKLEAGKKNIGFSLILRSIDGTLKDELVDQLQEKIIQGINKKFNAKLKEG